MIRPSILALALALLLSAPAVALDLSNHAAVRTEIVRLEAILPGSGEALPAAREIGRLWTELGRRKVANAADDGGAAMTRHAATYPNDPHVLLWLGSLNTMMARDASNVVNKVRYVNRGLVHLDRAVELAPNDFTVRITRGLTCVSLPSMFSQREKGVQDVTRAAEIFAEQPRPGMRAQMPAVYQILAEAAAAQGDIASRDRWLAARAAVAERP